MRRIKNRRALTVVELLLALALTALLLTAIAAAFNASAKNYEENDEIFKTMNKARQAMLRMTTELRTANWVNPLSTSSLCTLTTAAGQNISYQYNSTAQKLYTVINTVSYVLCDNVTAMSFKVDGSPVTSVEISMTVGIGDVNQTVSSAAVIKKNLQ